MPKDPSQVRVPGPLASFALGFADELVQQGYASGSIEKQLVVLAHLSRWLLAQGLGAADLHASVVDLFLSARRAAGYTSFFSIKALRPILDYLRSQDAAPEPTANVVTGAVDLILERFRHYLTVERALSNETARAYIPAVRPFLDRSASPDGLTLDFAHVTAADVVSFVVARCPSQSSSSARRTVKALRSLLRFLHVDGFIEGALISAVPSVSCRQLAGLPKGLEPDQVRRLLVSCDASTQIGTRDIAVLTILVRLGLRADEVAKLRLDDIDWRAGEIIIHGKANRIERLPLPVDVGNAVAEYLQRGRPPSAQGRTVFVRVRAPHRALGARGVSHVVYAAARRAGLERINAHRLRHTAATEMLHAGASLPEVGQILRHHHIMTTAIYAKVDRNALRTIARPWPGDAA